MLVRAEFPIASSVRMQAMQRDDMIVGSALLILGAYLLGSVSSAYLAGRWLGGKDLRQYGSGNLGGSMVWEHVARWAMIRARRQTWKRRCSTTPTLSVPPKRWANRRR